MGERSAIQVTYTATGLSRYAIEIRHRQLNKYQVVRGDSQYIVEQKARATLAQWDEIWERKKGADEKRSDRQHRARSIEEKKALAMERTQEAQKALSLLGQLLPFALNVSNKITIESLKDKSDFLTPQPSPPSVTQSPSQPAIPNEPKESDRRYQLHLNPIEELIGNVLPGYETARRRPLLDLFKNNHQQWSLSKAKIMSLYESQVQAFNKSKLEYDDYEKALADWNKKRDDFILARSAHNRAIDDTIKAYLSADSTAITEYFELILASSKHPDYFPQSYEIEYNPESKVLIVDYQLPPTEALPNVKEVKYVQARNEFAESYLSQTQTNEIYDNALYQITLRTVHEIFEADNANSLSAVVFNGYVHSIDKATGQEVDACVLSLMASRAEFENLNLEKVDPKACFKTLKGIGSSKLHSLAPVAPVLRIERADKRFIQSYAVADSLHEGNNLAAMDWEDFEHLVRELFEKEFTQPGSEVKVTRASRDGGIDAVVFDPDPLRGGKIVIQAKRYTNTVDVSAVRDLFGTVMNEGANKGILVTTSDYGPDAYEFAKGKPLVLLNGGNLLHLLDKHGHKAHIDLKEAKKILAENDNMST